jgi:hypothetical protein
MAIEQSFENALSVSLVEERKAHSSPFGWVSVSTDVLGKPRTWVEYIDTYLTQEFLDGRTFATFCSMKRELELHMTYKKVTEFTEDELMGLLKLRDYERQFMEHGFIDTYSRNPYQYRAGLC